MSNTWFEKRENTTRDGGQKVNVPDTENDKQ
jgi:hypothetical protein